MSYAEKKKSSTAECAGEIAPPRLLIKSIEEKEEETLCIDSPLCPAGL
jgi:hypothetical protein